MRVISGSAKGIRLANVPGKTTRPITDQVKESLFNIIGSAVVGKTFLDLFGGTGAVGIEALSRGAEHVVFIELNYRAYKVIQQNLQKSNLRSYASVYKKDAFVYLRGEPTHQYDFIYIAPPQYQGLWHKAMQALDETPNWLGAGDTIIVQIHPKEFISGVSYTNFTEYDRRDYGDTTLIFYERNSVQ